MATQRRGQTDKSRAAMRKPPRNRQWWQLALAGGAVAVIVLGVVGYFAFRASAGPPGTSMPDLGNVHVQTPEEPHTPYNSVPPTSGPHLPYLAPWGIHTQPIINELQVHNLEDGGVVIQYNCPSGCPDLVAKLKAIVERYPDRVILAPYPGMKSRIALTAWTRIDAFDQFDQARVERFVEAYRGIDHHKGPE